jgi:hypothetical protein
LPTLCSGDTLSVHIFTCGGNDPSPLGNFNRSIARDVVGPVGREALLRDAVAVNKIQVTVAQKDAPSIEVPGYLIAPGLAVQRSLMPGADEQTNDWNITHIPSGKRLCGSLPTRKEAIAAAEGFAKLADWTLDERALQPLHLLAGVEQIRNDILAVSKKTGDTRKARATEPLKLTEEKPVPREVTALGNEVDAPSRVLFVDEVIKLRDEAVMRHKLLLTDTQITELSLRIEAGLKWIAENHGKVSVKMLQGAEKKLAGIGEQLAQVRLENQLPCEVLEAITNLLKVTTAHGIRVPNAYIKVVIPKVLSFEADLLYADVPF